MVNLTLVLDDDIKSMHEYLQNQLVTLTVREQYMLSCLEADIDVALEATRPLGLIPRRGHIPFVILREGVEYTKEFRRANLRQSQLTIIREDTMVMETLTKLIILIRFKRGIRLTGLKCNEAYPKEEIDDGFYTYAAALEAQ